MCLHYCELPIAMTSVDSNIVLVWNGREKERVSKLELNQTLMQKWNQHHNDIKMFKNGSNHNLYIIYNIYSQKGSKPMHIIIYSIFNGWLVGLANGNAYLDPERETNIQNSNFEIHNNKIENRKCKLII